MPNKKTCQMKVKIRKPRKGMKSEAILTLTATTPATPTEIAESLDTSISNVSHTLKRYGIEPNSLTSFKKNRADILSGLQDKILSSVNVDSINSASLMQRAAAVGILYDKERLERGQSTANIAYDAGDRMARIEELRLMLESLQPVDKSVINHTDIVDN